MAENKTGLGLREDRITNSLRSEEDGEVESQGEARSEEGRSISQKGGARITRVIGEANLPSSKPTAGPPVDEAGLSGFARIGVGQPNHPYPGARAGKPTLPLP